MKKKCRSILEGGEKVTHCLQGWGFFGCSKYTCYSKYFFGTALLWYLNVKIADAHFTHMILQTEFKTAKLSLKKIKKKKGFLWKYILNFFTTVINSQTGHSK